MSGTHDSFHFCNSNPIVAIIFQVLFTKYFPIPIFSRVISYSFPNSLKFHTVVFAPFGVSLCVRHLSHSWFSGMMITLPSWVFIVCFLLVLHIFYLKFLHVCLLERLVCNFLFSWTFVWFSYQHYTRLIKNFNTSLSFLLYRVLWGMQVLLVLWNNICVFSGYFKLEDFKWMLLISLYGSIKFFNLFLFNLVVYMFKSSRLFF